MAIRIGLASALSVAAILVAGCADKRPTLEKLVEATPVTQTQKLDCDLIFPGPDAR